MPNFHDFNHTQVSSPSARSQQSALLITKDPDQEISYTLTDGRHSIGRSHKCDLVIKDQNVSRIHAWLESFEGQWKLIDNDSTNGTYINNQRIQDQTLKNGDRIRVGTTTIIFRDGE